MELETARLRLNALRTDDAQALFGYRADPRVSRFQGWQPASVLDAKAFIERQSAASIATPDGWFQRAMRLRQDGTLIGDLGIHLPAAAEDSVEFGISIAPGHQGMGYAREALQALFELIFGRMERHRIHASVDPRNVACMALLRSLGMRQEAHHRESLWLHGEWVDDAVFALLAREWAASGSPADPNGSSSR